MVYNWIAIKDHKIKYTIEKQKKKIFVNALMSFDIEVSSFFKLKNKTISIADSENYDVEKLEKVALPYIWQFAINDDIFIGRDLSDFFVFIQLLRRKFLSSIEIIIYVHNLSYEFQFIRKYFDWKDVFATDNRKVIYCTTKNNVTFKCSYFLSGKSLNGIAKELGKTQKLTGDLDYELIHTPETPINERELGYCINDVKIVNEYIETQIQLYGNLANIPYTNTGRVRRFTRLECFKIKTYHKFIKNLSMTKNEYITARACFSGGYVHANASYTNITLKNVESYDFTSSYPSVMLTEKFPMSKGVYKDRLFPNEIAFYSNKYCMMFFLELYNVQMKKDLQPIISLSKCVERKNCVCDNGRIVSADYIALAVTDIDYFDIKDFYEFDKSRMTKAYLYKKDYLPKPIIKSVLKFYNDKTQLKGVKGFESEYMLSKNMLNSLYGMCVYTPIKDQYEYKNNWIRVENPVTEHNINDYNNDRNRFLFYMFGIFVTSYARHNLFTAIKTIKNDFIYADTDSVKILHADKYYDYFNNYNVEVTEKLNAMCKYFNFDVSEIKPKTIDGIEKLLGVWDFDGKYSRFKTLGAKRYLTEKDDKLSITVSGVNSKTALKYLQEQFKTNDNIFDNFSNNLKFPKEYSGKKTHTYIDCELEGICIDYKGISYKYHIPSCVHLMNSEYNMSLANEYLQYFTNIQNKLKG